MANVKRIVKDKLLLVCVSMIVAISLLGLLFVLSYFSVTREWELFVGGVLMYVVPAMAMLSRSRSVSFRKFSHKTYFILTAAIVLGLPVYGSFLLFYFEILPLPRSIWVYWVGLMLFGPPAMACFQLCLRVYVRRVQK